MATTVRGAATDAVVEALRARVAAACRLLHMEGLLTYSGHVSARIPGRDALLIHPFDESRAAVQADSILVCGFDCAVLPESPRGKPPIETPIHAEIYRARPDVQSVIHTHSALAAAFTMVEDGTIQPMKSHAARWAEGIPVHPDPTHIETAQQGRELAATLGACHAALLRAHGGVVVAESIEAAVVDAVHFEENASAQVQALQIGRIKPLTADELALLLRRSNRAQHVAKLWAYYVERGRATGVLGPTLARALDA